MEIPDLNRIVDTYVPIAQPSFEPYMDQLRSDVVAPIRVLQVKNLLRWYSFLIHGSAMLGERAPADETLYIHLHLEPQTGIALDDFIAQLPAHFQKPQHVTLANIAGVEQSVLRDQNWAYAWKIHGEASEWVVSLIEAHSGSRVPLQQIVQFMHFITNPLMLGHRCLCIPAGFLSF